MSTRPLTLPRLHRNGSGVADLTSGLLQAEEALTQALDKMSLAAPNGRDYADAAALKRARAEHLSRMERVQEARTELRALRRAILAGGAP